MAMPKATRGLASVFGTELTDGWVRPDTSRASGIHLFKPRDRAFLLAHATPGRRCHAPTKNDGPRLALAEGWTGCQVLVLVILLVVHLHATGIHGIFQLTKDTHREDLHPLLLVGVEALIERLPRIGELFESGGSLG